MQKPKKVALAYSGGLDTSIIIPWLKEHYDCQVVAVCGDIGQGGEELSGLEAKARKTGASECYVADMREEFVSEYLWRMVRAGGEYEHKYLLGTSIARSRWKWRSLPAATRWRTAAPAKATTRFVSS
jgi:argininosuccinate synthase